MVNNLNYMRQHLKPYRRGHRIFVRCLPRLHIDAAHSARILLEAGTGEPGRDVSQSRKTIHQPFGRQAQSKSGPRSLHQLHVVVIFRRDVISVDQE